jgi:hypothetical protein
VKQNWHARKLFSLQVLRLLALAQAYVERPAQTAWTRCRQRGGGLIAVGVQALQRKDILALHQLAEVAAAEGSAESKPARGKGGKMEERAAKKSAQQSAELEQAQERVRLYIALRPELLFAIPLFQSVTAPALKAHDTACCYTSTPALTVLFLA